VKEKDG